MATLKNTLLQAAQSNAEIKACKRVFFLLPKKNFCPPSFLIKLFRHHTGSPHNQTVTTMDRKEGHLLTAVWRNGGCSASMTVLW